MAAAPPSPTVIVSANDLARLQALGHSLATDLHPSGSLLLRALMRAEVRETDGIPADSVALDRFVTYRIDTSDQPERRLLIHPDDSMWPPAELSVASPLGIALLGLKTGDRVPVAGSELGEPPWVEVLAVGAEAASGIARRPTFVLREPVTSLADRG